MIRSNVELLAVATPPKRAKIGTRWRAAAGTITRLDTSIGFFEQVNPLLNREERALQDLLCARIPVKKRSKWNPFPPKLTVLGGEPQ